MTVWPGARTKFLDVAPCPVCKAAAPRLDSGAFRCVHGHTFSR
ncbi:hypothetical protein WCD74_01710 [Actinomycetospora sp. OC33-EN08]|uniref:Uncharacterized protein n=1 Tax=Actinomycetospora aurantiaca TaxID=3129233 RepID=A0ABU8MGK1_9PSEU